MTTTEEARDETATHSIKATPHAKVLIVDDLEDARWVLSQVVRQSGFTPITAGDGATAVRMAQAERPDAIFLDVGLPDMNGFEVLDRVRKLGLRPRPD